VNPFKGFELKPCLPFAVSLVVLGLTTVTTFVNVSSYAGAAAGRATATEDALALDYLLIRCDEAAMAANAYVINRDGKCLAEYRRARDGLLAHFEGRVAGIDLGGDAVAEMRRVLALKVALIDRIVSRPNPRGQALLMLDGDFRRLHFRLHRLARAQAGILLGRAGESSKSQAAAARQLKWVVASGSLLTLAVFVFAYFSSRLELRRCEARVCHLASDRAWVQGRLGAVP
jgi:CHASE3 domain sensor protein